MALTTDLTGKIRELLDQAEKGALVRSMDAVYRILEEHNLLSEQRISARFMGVHRLNRDGSGVSCAHVSQLLQDLVELGWSHAEFKGMAIELSQKDSAEVRTYNQKLIAESGGGLADFQDIESLKFATIAGSHTTQVLRLFLSGATHNLESVSEQGRLSLSKLKKRDPDFHDAVINGATFKIVSRVVAEEFPDFCRLAQSAANASGHVAREETELQVCRKIVACVEELRRQKGDGASITLQDIKHQVLRSKPRCASTVPALFMFTLRFGGGSSAHLLQQTEAFVRAHGFANRALGIDLYEGLSCDLKGSDQKVLIRHMALQFAHALPDDKPLTPTDVKKLLANATAAKVEKAEQLSTKVKDFFAANQVPPHVALRAQGFLHVDLISLILEKKRFKKHDSMEAAVEAAVSMVNSHCGLSLTSPVSLPSATPLASSSSKSPTKTDATAGAESLRGHEGSS